MEKAKLHPLTVLGAALFGGGTTAWLWAGDWRWSVTGLIMLLVCAAIAGVMEARK